MCSPDLPYCFRNRLTESAKLRTYADQNSRRLQIIQLEVEVGTPLTQRVHRAKTEDSRQNTIPGLPDVKFIYFDKMVSDLEDEADRIIRKACEREDIEIDEFHIGKDRKSTRLHSSHYCASRMPY